MLSLNFGRPTTFTYQRRLLVGDTARYHVLVPISSREKKKGDFDSSGNSLSESISFLVPGS